HDRRYDPRRRAGYRPCHRTGPAAGSPPAGARRARDAARRRAEPGGDARREPRPHTSRRLRAGNARPANGPEPGRRTRCRARRPRRAGPDRGTSVRARFEKGATMCLGIPGEVVEILTDRPDLARVDVSGVKRAINIGLLADEDVRPGDWVLIH